MIQRQHFNDNDVSSRASTLVSPSDKIEFLKELDRSLVTDRDVICTLCVPFFYTYKYYVSINQSRLNGIGMSSKTSSIFTSLRALHLPRRSTT